MRTKQEVINFLESKVGTKVPCKGNSSLDGQCVTLIKALMEFLGMPDPYKARGHAKTCVQAYLNEGIADKGIGFISIFSNKNMGNGYGHVWCNAGEGNGVYYESNGVKPLICTKGKTYKYDNVCNFDRYIKDNPIGGNKPNGGNSSPVENGKDEMKTLEFLDCANFETAERKLIEHLGISGKKCAWGDASGDNTGGHLGSERRKVKQLEAKIAQQDTDYLELDNTNRETNTRLKALEDQLATANVKNADLSDEVKRLNLLYAQGQDALEQKDKQIASLKADVQLANIERNEFSAQSEVDYEARLEQEEQIKTFEQTIIDKNKMIDSLQAQIVTLKSQCNVDYITALERKCSELENRSLWEMLVERLKELLG